uniref:TSA: Wollemia nobilis Ref_Wollemi_Transcript_9603_1536 transcribed RNA sequence n=1 Tax=Wollemia nobilis TaxID=56998 RepID=A0A0C9RN38_9CONI
MKMRVQCDVCEKAEATLVCCADEAALCSACDKQIHAANKLASKHQRIPLINPVASSQLPKCDICQEKCGYFFCLEDRAILCRQCDVSIHSVNHLVAAHKRFLVSGVRVGLEPLNNLPSSSCDFAAAAVSDAQENQKTQPLRSNAPKEVSAAACQQGVPKGAGSGGLARKGSSVSEYFTESLADWRMDEFLVMPDLDNGYVYDEAGSSKADNANFGELEWTTSSFSVDDVNVEDCLAQVPEMPSPPTASGLYWPRKIVCPTEGKRREDFGFFEFYDAPLVPDIECGSSPPDSPLSKRRRLAA